MASQQVSDSPCNPKFIQEELDDVVLTHEQLTELELKTDWIHEGKDCSSLTLGSSSSGETKGSEEKKGEDVGHQTLRPGVKSKAANSISALSNVPASAWNKFPFNVYKNFKVDSYIVQPNYFLTASKTKPSSPESKPMLTIDQIFDKIHSGSSNFRQWNEIEHGVDSLLSAYDDFDLQNLPNVLSDKATSLNLATSFFYRLRATLKNLPSESFLRQVISLLITFAGSLLESIENQRFKKDLSVNYIMALVVYFEKLMRLPISHREKESMHLDLRDRKAKLGREMSIVPDLTVYYHGSCILVGEIKPLQIPTKEIGKDRSESVEPNTRSGKDKMPHDCERQTIQESEEHFESVQHAKRIKLTENETSCVSNGSSPKKAEENLVIGGGDTVVSDGVTKLQDTCDSSSDTSGTRCYRPLRKEEALKASLYLPQLLAEMFACIADNPANSHFGCDNESTQLGFAVEGFKLRFVRLVLRNTCNSKEKPTVSNIRNSDIRSDVFLTKEFNLFNKKHLKMFFQMLFALTYTHMTAELSRTY